MTECPVFFTVLLQPLGVNGHSGMKEGGYECKEFDIFKV